MGIVGELPFVEEPLLLRLGDTLVLARTDASPAGPALGCTLPEVFSSAKSGKRIFFDDGRVSASPRLRARCRVLRLLRDLC